MHHALLEMDEVKSYLRLKEEIRKDTDLMSLYQSIHQLQLSMKEFAKTNIIMYKKIQKKLEEEKKVFFNHPTIANYYAKRMEVENLLHQLNDIIQ